MSDSSNSTSFESDDAEELFSKWKTYILGIDVPVDKKKAAKYCKIAADKGHPKAMNNYATMLSNGDGIPIDTKTAAQYYKMSAEKRLPEGMYNYALA